MVRVIMASNDKRGKKKKRSFRPLEIETNEKVGSLSLIYMSADGLTCLPHEQWAKEGETAADLKSNKDGAGQIGRGRWNGNMPAGSAMRPQMMEWKQACWVSDGSSNDGMETSPRDWRCDLK